jgi:hypothetical protein
MENTDERSSVKCNPHPDAPHGFDRNASHNADRYVCECESWEPPKNKPMTRDEWKDWLEKSWDEAQARANTPEQKPVGYVSGFYGGYCVIQPTDPAVVLPAGMALYRAPREWVGLTDEEIWGSGSRLSLSESGIREFARAIEAKLKEKNT